MLRWLPLICLIACARYNLAQQCNEKNCKLHKDPGLQATSKKELRPRYQCKNKDSEGKCHWVKI